MKKVKRKVLKKQTYKMILIRYDDETSTMERVNDGFNAYELIWILTETLTDLLNQLKGLGPKPDVIKRKVIKRG